MIFMLKYYFESRSALKWFWFKWKINKYFVINLLHLEQLKEGEMYCPYYQLEIHSDSTDDDLLLERDLSNLNT